jgi:hypothetical protein
VFLPTQKTTSLESVFCWHTVGNAVCIALCCFQDRRLHYLNQSAVAIHSTTLLVLLCVPSNTEDYVLRVSLMLFVLLCVASNTEDYLLNVSLLSPYIRECWLYCFVLLPRQKATLSKSVCCRNTFDNAVSIALCSFQHRRLCPKSQSYAVYIRQCCLYCFVLLPIQKTTS